MGHLDFAWQLSLDSTDDASKIAGSQVGRSVVVEHLVLGRAAEEMQPSGSHVVVVASPRMGRRQNFARSSAAWVEFIVTSMLTVV